jgi:4-hydroxy-tetrahydrodipicolinate reductase
MTKDAIRVCLAGCTGWTSGAVARAILKSPEFHLVSAVARRSAGRDIGEVLGIGSKGLRIVGTLDEALREPVDVMIEYTSALAVKAHVLAALKKNIRVVIGSTGLTATDFEEIERATREHKAGAIAAANFAITAAIAKRCAMMAARHLNRWELIDYMEAWRDLAPGGTIRECAEALSNVQKNYIEVPLDNTVGHKEARGATVAGAQLHSVRLPGYTFSFEAIFGMQSERLTIRHDAGESAEPYVMGTLLAVKKVMSVTGLVRGMDTLLFGEAS